MSMDTVKGRDGPSVVFFIKLPLLVTQGQQLSVADCLLPFFLRLKIAGAALAPLLLVVGGHFLVGSLANFFGGQVSVFSSTETIGIHDGSRILRYGNKAQLKPLFFCLALCLFGIRQKGEVQVFSWRSLPNIGGIALNEQSVADQREPERPTLCHLVWIHFAVTPGEKTITYFNGGVFVVSTKALF